MSKSPTASKRDPEHGKRSRDLIERRIVVAFAGPLAAAKKFGRDEAFDVEPVSGLAAYVTASAEETEA